MVMAGTDRYLFCYPFIIKGGMTSMEPVFHKGWNDVSLPTCLRPPCPGVDQIVSVDSSKPDIDTVSIVL